MKTFILLVLIPALSGVLSGVFGVDIIDNTGLFFLINVPVCAFCSFAWAIS